MKFRIRKPVISKREGIGFGILVIVFLCAVTVINHNTGFYKKTIAEVVQVEFAGRDEAEEGGQNQETLYRQKLTLLVKNGTYQGRQLTAENEYSYSGAYDYKYRRKDQLFITIDDTSENLTCTITGMKRDQYMAALGGIFVLLIIIIGRKKGLYSVISLLLNVILFSFALDLYLRGYHLLLLCAVIVIIFTVFSLFLVSGNNQKTYAAILSTILSTFLSLVIAYIVMKVTKEKGIRYEEMQFITHPPYEIFMAEIFVGSLGAIMDISITMASSLYELYVKNPAIPSKTLKNSGMEIGKDIMGTMINVLFFAYVSGSIPMILLSLKNGMSFKYTFYNNLSLEMVRALTGSIGIVITIPIALYITVLIIDKGRVRQ